MLKLLKTYVEEEKQNLDIRNWFLLALSIFTDISSSGNHVRLEGTKNNFWDNKSAYNVCLTHLNFPFYKFVMYSLSRQAKLLLPPIIPWLPIGSHREIQITHNYSIAIVISNDLVICNMQKVVNCSTGK